MTSPVWRPFFQHAVEPDPPVIVRAEGAYLHTSDGRALLDAISSWWVTTHGHRHPRIMAAIREATESLDQMIFATVTHEPAERLARELVAIAPAGLAHVFYSDSGSTAVEVALKMALGAFANRGEKRTTIVALEGAYHGDTIGTMSVGERGVFNAAYEPLLFDVARLPFPALGREQATLDRLEQIARAGGVAALIVEPLVLGAGGMRMYPPSVLTELGRIAREAGALVIADEVMTGWGRTGSLFACEQAGLSPDILCTSKGLTGGAVPLAATLATAEIFEAHLSTDRSKTFFHSSSYTANPIACAAAVANLEVWRDEPVRARIAALGAAQSKRIARFEGDPRFANPRVCGTIAAVDLVAPDTGYLAEIGLTLRSFFLDRGLLVRPLGEALYLMPPYCVTETELDRLYDAFEEAAGLMGDPR
ncbi:adenosylmethionine-8-amino-7-oxononanoate aminotransferase [Methylopila capsulata]|uniref:Adenosylmethionine-8-amino-7-oxononanoate aminotransferase n=1 Tax=Methylopila capsulata TaxID=61654 RepID=A0A9W6IXX5_9HYPH|nr:adenosylmethionine--8-amino-7-oxononanoate transaminase [Methylopila capsulata]MBM7852930.1 adenosylmethionine-8-amino-7-oxononanoate aminotransferase [Methylopila capsulata]GLK57141.1 adenosylmethionine--8-amino-7-oxononanoate aminotransferase BioA [Methylopila capsulata]